jgi:hypothetical protein
MLSIINHKGVVALRKAMGDERVVIKITRDIKGSPTIKILAE